MKTKLTISVVLLFLAVAFISKIPEAEEKSVSNLQPGSAIPDNGFMLCAVHNAHDQANNYANMKGYFHLNTWHKYTAPTCWGWYLPGTDDIDTDDEINGDTSEYGPHVRQSISNNDTAELRTIMDHPVIQYLAFGQRSDYQCEDLDKDDSLWFYSYYHSEDNDSTINDTIDSSPFGNNQEVKLCLPSLSSAGYIVDSLKANREQANKKWPSWISDYASTWYIKPRIRIDPDFADTNPNDTVCRIDIIDWNDSTIKKVGILGINFKDEYLNYNGRYIDSFYFSHTNNEGALKVDPEEGDSICPGDAKDFWNWNDPDLIKTDFRVYWYGTCEMWIDYVRVENEPSVKLHSGIFDERIRRELQGTFIDFDVSTQYVMECELNNLPCIDYITRVLRLRQAPNNFSLIVYNPFYIDSLHKQNIAALY